jgi:hypothetical protein
VEAWRTSKSFPHKQSKGSGFRARPLRRFQRVCLAFAARQPAGPSLDTLAADSPTAEQVWVDPDLRLKETNEQQNPSATAGRIWIRCPRRTHRDQRRPRVRTRYAPARLPADHVERPAVLDQWPDPVCQRLRQPAADTDEAHASRRSRYAGERAREFEQGRAGQRHDRAQPGRPLPVHTEREQHSH